MGAIRTLGEKRHPAEAKALGPASDKSELPPAGRAAPDPPPVQASVILRGHGERPSAQRLAHSPCQPLQPAPHSILPVPGGVACPSSASEPWVVTTAAVLPDVVPDAPSPTAVLGK